MNLISKLNCLMKKPVINIFAALIIFTTGKMQFDMQLASEAYTETKIKYSGTKRLNVFDSETIYVD